MQEKQNKEFIHHISWTSMCSQPSSGQQVSIMHKDYLRTVNKYHHPSIPPLVSSFPSCICWAWLHLVQDISLVSGVSCPSWVFFSLLSTPSPLTGRLVSEAGKALTLCEHCSEVIIEWFWLEKTFIIESNQMMQCNTGGHAPKTFAIHHSCDQPQPVTISWNFVFS